MKFLSAVIASAFVACTIASPQGEPPSKCGPGAQCDTPGGPAPPADAVKCTETLGEKILAKAEDAVGLPYAWGGGNCTGPTHDLPPYQYGEIGFDCSGLLCWAICQVTGRDLFSEGLRVTRVMYCAPEEKLKYKKVPYDDRRPGDAVFFGGECDCKHPKTIHHVGLVMNSLEVMWNSPNHRINRVSARKISSMGEKPCPYVIRF